MSDEEQLPQTQQQDEQPSYETSALGLSTAKKKEN
jgi:hypothetical protein